MLWFILQKISVDKTVIANLNGFKREFALAAAGGVLAMFGGGSRFTLLDLIKRSKLYFSFKELAS